MAFKRVDTILRKVQGRLKDRAQRTVTSPEILSEMNGVYEDICRDYLALKLDDELIMAAGVTEYELDILIYKVWRFIRPVSWTKNFEITMDPAIWDEWQRDTTISGDYPVKGFVWDKRLRVMPAPSTSGERVALFAFGFGSYALAEGKDPETASAWDDCLELGTAWKLTGDDALKNQFETRCRGLANKSINETMQGVTKGQHWSDIGF